MVYPIAKRTLFPFVRFFIRKTVGLENVPLKGPYIIACKHMGPMDGVFIAAVIIPRIDDKIFFVSNVAKWGWFWEKIVAERWAGSIPFYRENPKICLDIAQDYLRKGKVVGIFPEGLLQEFSAAKHHAKTGVARLALWSRVPIVPVGLVHDISVRADLPRLLRRRQVIKNVLLNPHSMEIHIGKPFELNQFYGKKVDRELLYGATDYIMAQIDNLTSIHARHL
ncbi:MAG: lysophospholipid acyltransferase family protein [Patescibacteria group bacterium]|nr:lysophospholipid acyltransferase family protein [Patescibacteria group bacterium]MDD5715578.1 lysophospholipid acyltransferase family protein [Patescibacteria group bacterium]